MHYSFRPLARWIGCSTQWSYVINQDFLKFPTSREVDRFLYLYQETCDS